LDLKDKKFASCHLRYLLLSHYTCLSIAWGTCLKSISLLILHVWFAFTSCIWWGNSFLDLENNKLVNCYLRYLLLSHYTCYILLEILFWKVAHCWCHMFDLLLQVAFDEVIHF
jgi:hypothetical protein